MQQRTIVVQNAGELTRTVRAALDDRIFDIRYVEGFAKARKVVVQARPDLIPIDIETWERSVEELLGEFGNMRSTRCSRKVILASNAEEEDRILALASGADGFLLKPISTREFSARLKATLRSYVPAYSADEPSLGVLRLRRNELEVVANREPKKLSRTEFNLLAFLMDHYGQVLTREVLLENLWLPAGEVESGRIVDVYVCRLREKIEDDPTMPTRLITRRGHGSSLIDPQQTQSYD